MAAKPKVQPEPEGNPLPEANLHKHFKKCEKNPDHKDFIPITKFGMEHLPERFRQRWRLQRVLALADLTVRLKATTISPRRPKQYPWDEEEYPFHMPDGGSRTRTGTGFIRSVLRCGEGGIAKEDLPCQCSECKASNRPEGTWWKLSIASAQHVLFDQKELVDMEVNLFFDSGNRPSPTAAKARTDVIVRTELPGDRSYFTAIVHDWEAGKRLEKAWETYRTFKREHPIQADHPVIVIGHPHGCSKHVTVGEVVRDRVRAFRDHIQYTAATCPGSSGCVVWCGGRTRNPITGRMLSWPWWLYPHSGASGDGYNESGMGWWY